MELSETTENEGRQFINFSDEEFVGMWAKKEHKIGPKVSRNYPRFLAEHLAKHFVDRELQKAGLRVDDQQREAYLERCLGPVFSSDSPEGLQVELMNRPAQSVPPVSTPTPTPTPTPESTFAGVSTPPTTPTV